jgi:hypothetical protein
VHIEVLNCAEASPRLGVNRVLDASVNRLGINNNQDNSTIHFRKNCGKPATTNPLSTKCATPKVRVLLTFCYDKPSPEQSP